MALRSCKRLSCSPCTRRAAIVLSLAVLISGVSVWAQNTNGRVIGFVADPQGAAVAGAKVTVTNLGTNLSWNTVTDGNGSYQVLDVPIGMYKVTVESRESGPVANRRLAMPEQPRVFEPMRFWRLSHRLTNLASNLGVPLCVFVDVICQRTEQAVPRAAALDRPQPKIG